MNVYHVRMFSNGMVSFAMAERVWKMFWEWSASDPVEPLNSEQIANVRAALVNDRHSTIRMLAKWFHIDKESIRKIILEDLVGKKLCVRFVPHALMSEQQEDRGTSCCNFLQMHESDSEFLNKIITGNESGCFAYDPESKRQSATWVGPCLPEAKKLRFKELCIKTMLVTFFNSRGLIYREFVPTGKTVNAKFYKDVLNRLIKRINTICSDLRASRDWFLQHDNALAHNTASVCQFLVKKMLVFHPTPYSPDLARAAYFLFPKLKLQLRKAFWRYSNHSGKCDRHSEGHSGNGL